MEPTIGLEIHTVLDTKTKMFCSCPNDLHESHPNVNVCPVCMGHPGNLPTINKKAVEKVILLGMALGGEVADKSHFDRKSYFYPDLPKGYQISQFDEPLIEGGNLEDVRITRVHLEEDAGSLSHTEGDYSLVNYNRAGVPLAELVTEPDIRSAEHAIRFAKELQKILQYIGISEANMEKGQMRVEANVSLDMGTKVELKNINSFRAVKDAVEYEIKRQRKAIEDDEEIVQETRGWDEDKQKTFSQRTKESAHDYRYFPEPDLPPLKIKEEWTVSDLRNKMPELPKDKKERFMDEFDLSEEDINLLTKDKPTADYFEEAVSELKSFDSSYGVESLFNYLTSELRGLMKEKQALIEDIKITPESLAHMVHMVKSGEISSKMAKDILEEMFKTGKDPEAIKKEGNFDLISDEGELEDIAREVIDENESAVNDYRDGKDEAVKYLVGQVMAKTKGQADPKLAGETLKEILDSE